MDHEELRKRCEKFLFSDAWITTHTEREESEAIAVFIESLADEDLHRGERP